MAIATLPIVLAVVLTELAVGGAFLLWFIDRGGRAPSGFLKLVAFVNAGDLAETAGIDTGPLNAFGQALVVVTILVVIQLITTFTSARGLRMAAGIVTFLAGAAALAVVAVARPAQQAYDPFAIAALPLGAIALGGSDGAMLLGHWYLVTPKLSPGPLRRAALGLRIGVGLLMTLLVALAAWWTAGMNTQSSTGLLYVALGCVIAGEISARVIYFLTGVPISTHFAAPLILRAATKE